MKITPGDHPRTMSLSGPGITGTGAYAVDPQKLMDEIVRLETEVTRLTRLATGRHTPSPYARILWNTRDKDIDEVVITDATVHVEQMDKRCWWIGINRADGTSWDGNFVCDSRGRMKFTEQECNGIEWDKDDSHDEQEQ